MSRKDNNIFNVDDLLNSLFPSANLNDLFEQRVKELNITPTNVLEILDIEYRPLQSILHGTKTRIDATNFAKLASFLKIPKEQVFSLYYEALEKNFPSGATYPESKINFMNANFDLPILKKAGFISSITNYPEIEHKINTHFGFKSIFEYKLPKTGIAFSAGVVQPKNIYTRGLWINSAIAAFKEFANPYEYDRKGLIDYFPNIRWQSTNVEEGLNFVISDLYKLGITVFYQSSLPTLHLRGATVVIDGKPCIVLTDYVGFYATLWHTLCHELSHVLFDFKQIQSNTYHISGEDSQDLAVVEKEREANNFAREYLFSTTKLEIAKPHMSNKKFIYDFADENDVHPSFIYAYHAFEEGKENPSAWAAAKRHNPSLDNLLKNIENPWGNPISIKEHVNHLKNSSSIYK